MGSQFPSLPRSTIPASLPIFRCDGARPGAAPRPKGGVGMKRLGNIPLVSTGAVALGLWVGAANASAGDPTEIAGTVRETHGDDFAHHHEVDEQFAVQTASGAVDVSLPAGVAVTPGQHVRLKGHYEGQG